ncbi:hypothetical protein CA13_28510 [Planctomycetes bacterium CA13]|uniref:Uncharacterized protein n=1 Tax=Novipirellula herctigrandis TaxID=2527986 RepID=A0A5C5Z1Z2_9BACT|nr:hypothetical protein CA13_28510 [Planctomycetes bacterium CA13]
MRRWNQFLFTILVLSLTRTAMAQQASAPTKEVAQRVASYVGAFNRRDVAACANHWSETSEYGIAGAANPIVGREAIRNAIEKLLSTDEEFQLAIGDQRFRQVSNNVVLEEGTARLASETYGAEYARYLVVHVRQKGTWYRDSVRETAVGTESNDTEGLESLVGTWKCEADNATLTVKSTWKHDKRFIERSFTLQDKNGQSVTATEMIGWDPASLTLRSWSFDSQGGFEQAIWNRDSDGWLIKADAVLPGGITATEQRSLSIDSEGNLRTQSLEQQFGGRLMPGSKPVTLIRQTTNQVSNPNSQQGETP